MDRKTKIIIAVAAVAIVIVAIIALGESDDYDYKSQAEQEIDKYGYDSEVTVTEVQRGQNLLGAYIIRVDGTFTSNGEEHTFVMVTDYDHNLESLHIDDRIFWGDVMGDATYNYVSKGIGAFSYTTDYGYSSTESPAAGMQFVLVTLTVKNVGHSDGMTVSAPLFENSQGNRYEYDWSATYYYEDSYSDLSGVSIGLGNTMTYNLVYEVPEGTAEGAVVWDDLYLELYGYMLDETLGAGE